MSTNRPVQPALQVENNSHESRFECSIGDEISVLEYSNFPGELVLLHTGVPVSLRGRGVASALTRSALDFARSQHLVVTVRCSFVSDYIDRHPEFSDLLKLRAETPQL